MFLVTLTDL